MNGSLPDDNGKYNYFRCFSFEIQMLLKILFYTLKIYDDLIKSLIDFLHECWLFYKNQCNCIRTIKLNIYETVNFVCPNFIYYH